MLKSNLCDYTNAYILVKRIRAAVGEGAKAAAKQQIEMLTGCKVK